MVGEVIWQSDEYKEIVEAQENGARLVECSSPNVYPMYRLEYTERGYPQHSVFYDWPSASANFERRAAGE